MIMSNFYIQKIFTMIMCGCIKRRCLEGMGWGGGDIFRKGGVTDGTYSAVQPNIDTDQWYKNFITHAYPQLHISDCSTTAEKQALTPINTDCAI